MIQQPELGKKIADLRKAKALTQDELVTRCNINVRTLQRIESGEVIPRISTVKLIFEALDYPFDDLISINGRHLMKLEQFYISLVDLINLKTNTMKKVTVLSIILVTVIISIFAFNPDLLAQDSNMEENSKIDLVHSLEKQGDSNVIIPKVIYLFQWALNPIEVNLPEGSNFMTDNGVIKRIGDEIYLTPYKIGELKVSSRDFAQKFEVLPLPDTRFKIGGDILRRGSEVSVSKLIENREINVHYGSGLKTDFDVFEYSITFNPEKSNEEKFVVNGNQITDKALEIIHNGLKDNHEVWIDYLGLRFPDGFVSWNGAYKIEK